MINVTEMSFFFVRNYEENEILGKTCLAWRDPWRWHSSTVWLVKQRSQSTHRTGGFFVGKFPIILSTTAFVTGSFSELSITFLVEDAISNAHRVCKSSLDQFMLNVICKLFWQWLKFNKYRKLIYQSVCRIFIQRHVLLLNIFSMYVIYVIVKICDSNSRIFYSFMLSLFVPRTQLAEQG